MSKALHLKLKSYPRPLISTLWMQGRKQKPAPPKSRKGTKKKNSKKQTKKLCTVLLGSVFYNLG